MPPARLLELVAAHRIVTVVGPGGTGKTRPADEVCTRRGAVFAGGIRTSELAQVPPRDDIAIEVAGPLGFASINSLVMSLADARSLLVLDNCENLIGATARLCAQLLAASPALHLLATSREPLGVDGEQVLVLGPLALPATSDPDDALQASATRLFDDRARHRGRRAAIDASYTLLDPEEQAFLRALGVFAGAFSAQLAHDAAALPGFDLLHSVDALSRLVDRSLVTAAQSGAVTSYRLLESLRDYATEPSIAAGEWDALGDRFVDAVVAEADRLVVTGAARSGYCCRPGARHTRAARPRSQRPASACSRARRRAKNRCARLTLNPTDSRSC